MRKPFIAIALILLMSSLSYAFEDYRWEKPSTVAHSTGFIALPRTAACQNTSVPEPPCSEKSFYETEKEKKTLDVLKETPTPLRTPDTIIRVLMLPYTDSNNVLHSNYYTFLKVEDGSWILGDYLNSAANKPKKMILHHIDAPVASGEGIQQPQHDKKEEIPQQPASRRPVVTTSQPEQNPRDDQEGK